MTKALTVAELNKAIDALNQNAVKLGESYQEVGLLCLTHLKAHGDVGPVNRLLLGMPKSTRRLAMATWMVAHGALVPNQDQGTRDTMPLRFAKDKETNLDTAAAMKWYEAAPERNISDVFDLQVAIKQLIARAKGKTIKIGGEDKGHEAKAILSMMAVGVGLPSPFAEEEAKAAEAAAKAKADEATAQASASAKDAVQAGTSANADKPAMQREEKAEAKGRPAAKKASAKTAAKKGRAHA
jgi:hypothetical protein